MLRDEKHGRQPYGFWTSPITSDLVVAIYFSNNIDQRLYRQDAGGGRRARSRRLQPQPLWMRSGTQMALSTAGGGAWFASERTTLGPERLTTLVSRHRGFDRLGMSLQVG